MKRMLVGLALLVAGAVAAAFALLSWQRHPCLTTRHRPARRPT